MLALFGLLLALTIPISVAPSPSPSSSPTQQVYDGCNIFPSYSYFNENIASAPLASNSAAAIQSFEDANTAMGIADNFGNSTTSLYRLNVDANGTATTYAVHSTSSHTFAVQYPWASSYFIEPGGSGTDQHAYVLNTAGAPNNCELFETYNTSFSGGVLSAYSGMHFPLGLEETSNATEGGVTEARSSAFAPSLKYAEVVGSGPITHVLDAIYVYTGGKSQLSGSCSTYPALSATGETYGGPAGADTTNAICQGDRLRLHANFTSTYCTSASALKVITALQQYGMYFDDSSSYTNELRMLDNDADGSADQTSWASPITSCLSHVSITNFDKLATVPAGSP